MLIPLLKVKLRSKVSLSKFYGLVVNVRSEVEASKGQGKTMKVLYAFYSLYLCLLNIFQENFKLYLSLEVNFEKKEKKVMKYCVKTYKLSHCTGVLYSIIDIFYVLLRVLHG